MKLASIPTNNTYAIGDIHGCLKSLKSLLSTLPLNQESVLIFLGDYIDRGPDSKGVIDYLIQLSIRFQCYFLVGNHEVMMADALKTGKTESWELNGARQTLASYVQDDAFVFELPDSHALFLDRTEWFIDTPDFFFVHAGANPFRKLAESVAQERWEDFVWERSHLPVEKPVWEKTVVCGHTPHKHPLIKEKLIVIDTGCVYVNSKKYAGYGHLTAIQLPSKKVFMVKNCE